MHDEIGLTLFIQLTLGFSHLNVHKFTVNPMCFCGGEIESTEHYLLRCQNYSTERSEVLVT